MTTPTSTLIRTLDQLLPGQVALVRQIGGRSAFRHRVSELGLRAGAEIEMLGTAPQGDPIEYAIDGTIITLRRAEARVIVVEC